MDYKTALSRAKELNGIAVEAWPRKGGGWNWGGWSGAQHDGQQWVVISIDKQWVLATGSDDNIDIGQDAVKPQLPQRVPGQSLTDAYAQQILAEQEETALKAHRLNEVHEWLKERYATQVATVQLYKQRVYAEVLYFIETGRKPTDNPEDMANFERDQYDAVWSFIEQRERGTQ